MICISGYAGSGKDECAGRIVKGFGAIQTGLADSGKRHLADVYGFTEQQLFGPSHFRNDGDVRIQKNSFRKFNLEKWKGPLPEFENKSSFDKKYIPDPEKKYWTYMVKDFGNIGKLRPCIDAKIAGYETVFVKEGDPEFWLSPREALQIYLEKMNTLDIYTWIRKGIEDQIYLASGKFEYHRMQGVFRKDKTPEDFDSGSVQSKDVITCFADFRHIQEIQYARDFSKRSLVAFKPVMIRVKRPSIPVPPYDHRSETEQVKIRDAAFDAIINNDSDLPSLYVKVDEVITKVISGEIQLKTWKDEYVKDSQNPSDGYAP